MTAAPDTEPPSRPRSRERPHRRGGATAPLQAVSPAAHAVLPRSAIVDPPDLRLWSHQRADFRQGCPAMGHNQLDVETSFRLRCLVAAISGAYIGLLLALVPYASVPGPVIPQLVTVFATGVAVTEAS